LAASDNTDYEARSTTLPCVTEDTVEDHSEWFAPVHTGRILHTSLFQSYINILNTPRNIHYRLSHFAAYTYRSRWTHLQNYSSNHLLNSGSREAGLVTSKLQSYTKYETSDIQ